MLRRLPAAVAVPAISIFLLLLSSAAHAHNITTILAKHPEFSTFNHYLTVTHLAGEINRRLTITVLALDNSAMSSLLSQHFSLGTIKNVLSLHILADYYSAKKLHQLSKGTTMCSSLFQASGDASGTSGYVNITNMKGGKVGFSTEDNGGKFTSFYVKSLLESAYKIAVLQISQVLNNADAEAPTAAPSNLTLTTILTKQGCGAFSDLLVATGADETFQSNVDGGLTVFCPTDTVLNGFLPKYKNLTAAHKVSLLLYHGVPVYQSLQMLKSNNGLINTLATDGAKKYDFNIQTDGEDVTLETKVVTATITGTMIDQEPLVVYKIDKVLQPTELFKAAPETKASSPKASKAKAPAASESDDDGEDADAPADSDDSDDADDVADQKAKNGAMTLDGRRSAAAWVIFTVWMGVLLM